jgi:hypothetical protein
LENLAYGRIHLIQRSNAKGGLDYNSIDRAYGDASNLGGMKGEHMLNPILVLLYGL